MISIDEFTNELKKNNLNFFSGVPDSLFKDFCFEIDKKFSSSHYVAANEGSAVGIGIGYHLKTRKVPVIYMQNSGLGNAVNPLISLANSKIFLLSFLIELYKPCCCESSKTFCTSSFMSSILSSNIAS